MGGFMDPFIASPGWTQDSAAVFAGSSWAISAGSSATHAMDFHLRNGGGGGSAKELGGGPVLPCGTVLSSTPAKLHGDEEEEEEQQLLLQSDGGLDFAAAAASTLDSILGAPVSLAISDIAPVKIESSGSEQSGAGLPQFILGEQQAAWLPAYADIIPSIAGEETSTQSFGFGVISGGDDLLHKNNNTYQHHLDLSSLLVPRPPPPPPVAAPFNATGAHHNVAGCTAAPKPRARARRGQATDPHSIAERLRREKISERMKDLQELVPNSNKTDKASMLEEIIEYIKFLQLQTKVLSMSRLGATEAVVPLLTDSQNENESSGLLVSPRSRSGERHHGGGGGGEELFGDGDSAALEQEEIVQLMENNMTAAMQYLQSRGLCLMPIALASAVSTKKGTSSAAAVWPQHRDGCGNGHVAGV